MTRRQPTLLIALLGLMLTSVVHAAPACGDLQFRIWQPSGATYFDHGETIQIEAGESAHLYIHHRGKSQNPYGTSASIGHGADYGHKGRYTDRSVLTFAKQSGDDVRDGRLEIQTHGPGRVVLGYRVTDVKSPGLFDRLRPACRTGLVTIQVGRSGASAGGGGGGATKPAPSARRAAQELSRGLHLALMPWQNKQFDPVEVDDVLRRGRGALVDIATRILVSQAFQQGAYDETMRRNPELARQAGGTPRPGLVANNLLDGLHQRVYGGLRVTDAERRSHMEPLLSCLQRPEGTGCRAFAEGLIGHPNYAQHHREAIDAIEAGG